MFGKSEISNRHYRISVFINCWAKAAVIALFFCVVLTDPSSTAIYLNHQGTTSNCITIIDAVNAASAKDTVLFTPGIYIENGTIPINSNLKITSTTGRVADVSISGGAGINCSGGRHSHIEL